VFVTHDQEDALAVADRVGVMRAGQPSRSQRRRSSTPTLSDGQEVEAQISSALAATLSPQDKVSLTVSPDAVLVVGE
jgi:ABC-type sulfate/molybdate transport systems ATPase subunit